MLDKLDSIACKTYGQTKKNPNMTDSQFKLRIDGFRDEVNRAVSEIIREKTVTHKGKVLNVSHTTQQTPDEYKIPHNKICIALALGNPNENSTFHINVIFNLLVFDDALLKTKASKYLNLNKGEEITLTGKYIHYYASNDKIDKWDSTNWYYSATLTFGLTLDPENQKKLVEEKQLSLIHI